MIENKGWRRVKLYILQESVKSVKVSMQKMESIYGFMIAQLRKEN